MSISPRWKKIIRDLWSNKARTVLVILAIAVGVFAFGSVFITQETLLKNMQILHNQSRPPTITLFIDNFKDDLISWAKRQKNVVDAQGRAVYSAKILKDGKKYNLNLYAFKEYDNISLNKIQPLKGSWPPKKKQLIFERSYLSLFEAQLNDEISVELPSGRQFKMTFAGTVYDINAIPTQFEPLATSYVSFKTLAWLGYPNTYNRLEIRTRPEINTIAKLEDFAFQLKKDLENRGVSVNGSSVRKPDEHWGADPSRAFTAILNVIGSFSLVLSAFLVINTISAILAQQKKQIGIMKAVGGTGKQITTIYLAMVAFYGILSLFIALPIGILLGFLFLKSVTNFLNLDIVWFQLPLKVFLMQLVAALVVPTVAALMPIVKGVKITVRQALTDVRSTYKASLFDRLLVRFANLPRPMAISLRNTFRKKGRLFMTLGTLVVGGTLFISVINVREGMLVELLRQLKMFDFEVNLSLGEDYNTSSVEKRAGEVAGVTQTEIRTSSRAQLVYQDKSKGSSLGLQGVRPDSVFLKPVMLYGRWLEKGDQNAIVLGSPILKDEPSLGVGQQITLEIDDEEYTWRVTGVVIMATGSDVKLAYVDFDYLSKLKDSPDKGRTLLVKTEPKDGKTQDKIAKDLEDRLKRAGIKVLGSETKQSIVSGASSQFDFLTGFLLTMAVMVAVVGGLGLAGTMSLNVIERTREIGVMRSIGASNKAIAKIVLVEGILIGFLSWLLAIPLSIPATLGFDLAIGTAFFNRQLPFTFFPSGVFVWLAAVVVIASLASLLPVRTAVKMTIRDTLAYE